MTRSQHKLCPARVPLLTLFALGMLLTGCQVSKSDGSDGAPVDKPADLPEVTVETAVRGDIQHTISISGTLVPPPNHEAKISAPFAGRLFAVTVQPNQYVPAGTVVARMVTDSLLAQMQQAQAAIAVNLAQVEQARIASALQKATTRIQIAQAQAALAGVQASATNARENLDRLQSLNKDGLVSQKDVEDARLQLSTSESAVAAQLDAVSAAKAGSLSDTSKAQDINIARDQVASAYGALSLLQSQIALSSIKSPLSGMVTSVTANSGEVVDTTVPLMTIVDPSTLNVTVSVPSASIGFIKVGDAVRFSAEPLPGRSFVGVVQSLGAQVDVETGTVPVTVSLSNTNRLLKDDMSVSGTVVVGRHSHVVLVPQSAVLSDPVTDKRTVLVIDAAGISHLRSVETGLSENGRVEIVSGVRTGDLVAVSGQYAISDGTKVSVHGES